MNNYDPEILKIKSYKNELPIVESFLFQYFEKLNIAQNSFNKVLLCVSEAIINAIQHGNKNDISKKVTVKILFVIDSFYIEIRDEGIGFNYNCINDPTKTEYIKSESGRGLHIIRSLSDNLEFKENGTCISFKIRIE